MNWGELGALPLEIALLNGRSELVQSDRGRKFRELASATIPGPEWLATIGVRARGDRTGRTLITTINAEVAKLAQ